LRTDAEVHDGLIVDDPTGDTVPCFLDPLVDVIAGYAGVNRNARPS